MTITHKSALYFRWAARILGTPLALLIFVDFLHDVPGPQPGDAINLFRLSLLEQVLLDMVLVAALGLLLAWRHETAGGWIATVGGVAFLIACMILSEMRPVWGLGTALTIPGLLYLLAAHESHAMPAPRLT